LKRIEEAGATPILEDGVEPSAGAVLPGRVRIDVLPHALTVGVPAHIVERRDPLPDTDSIGVR
jgi:hypothetical protein